MKLQKMGHYFFHIFFILLLITPIIEAKTITIPSSGRSLSKALARAQSGDTLLLSSGRYVGRFIIPPGVTLIADSLHQAKLRANGRDRVVILTNRTTISGLDIAGGQVGVFSGGFGNTIEKCAIHSNDQSGISGVNYPVHIVDNIIYRNSGSGIQLWDIDESDTPVEHNTIVFNLNHGISLGGTSSIIFHSNIIAFNQKLTIKAEPKVIIDQSFNVYYYNSEINMALPENNFSFNPLFFAQHKNLYYVTKDSHCLKNGKYGSIIGTRIFSHLYY